MMYNQRATKNIGKYHNFFKLWKIFNIFFFSKNIAKNPNFHGRR